MDTDFRLQKRKTKMTITDDIIDKVPCTHILDSGKDMDKFLQESHKRLLKISKVKNNSDEVGVLIDTRTWDSIIILGTENSVSLNNNKYARILLSEAPDLSLIFLHNHPNNTCFSYVDLNSFCNHKSIRVITAIGNNANIHILKKSNGFNSDAVLMVYNRYSASGKGVQYVIQHSTRLGMEYKFGRRRK